ncbi:hypothetical protein Bca4012_001722 [Brassica carinata]
MDSTNPYSHTSNFVDLLNCQQDCNLPEPFPYEYDSQIPVFSTQATETSSFCEESRSERKERRKWTPSDDLVLISAWLNTSKDSVISNEQKSSTFWGRIAAYYAASPKVAGGDKPEPLQCKKRWQKLNDLVCKFCGSYATATRQKTKKWCEHATSKVGGSTKKRKCDDGAETSSSQATINLDEEPTKRPAGVKASKAASAKKPVVDNEVALKFQAMCSIKEKKLVLKERVSKMTLLNSLISKTDPLSEIEEAVKTKLLTEMLGN